MRLFTFRCGLVLLAFTCFFIWNKSIPSDKGKRFLSKKKKNNGSDFFQQQQKNVTAFNRAAEKSVTLKMWLCLHTVYLVQLIRYLNPTHLGRTTHLIKCVSSQN